MLYENKQFRPAKNRSTRRFENRNVGLLPAANPRLPGHDTAENKKAGKKAGLKSLPAGKLMRI